MLVFVDESGDTGLKLCSGSSPYFTVTAVWFDDNEAAVACDQRIRELRAELHVSPEFKFYKTRPEKRIAFLKSVCQFDFRYTSVVINKQKLHGKGFQYKRSFYKTAVNYTMQNLLHTLVNAKIVLDRTGDKEFTKSMQSYLKKATRRPNGTARIRKVRTEDSKKNNLLQLADMVCGAVARSFTDRNEASTFREIVERREDSVQFWPR